VSATGEAVPPRTIDTQGCDIMKTQSNLSIAAILVLALASVVAAECPLDHFVIGCNRDGIEGTADDLKLFADCSQKYRNSGDTEYAHWFYPLRKSIFSSYGYRIGEPGFDAFQAHDASASTYDPNRALLGSPDVDYSVVIECLAMSPGLRAVHKEYPQFTIGNVGESIYHSYIYALRGDGHIHMSYQATDGETLHWITFRLYDEIEDVNQYEPSEPFTIVFNVEPAAGDLVVDGAVDLADLVTLTDSWLAPVSARQNDYLERADANRDGRVDWLDFALLASNWRISEAEKTF